MATNVSERTATLEEVLATLSTQAARIRDEPALDARHNQTDRVYTAGKLAALANATHAVNAMLDALWMNPEGTP